MQLTHRYNIHGIITVESEAALPALDYFRVRYLHEKPTVRVRMGTVPGSPPNSGRQASFEAGDHGFATRMVDGDGVEILLSPHVQWSPHVLYTNVVEPVLRWLFVERGYALVRGACLALDDEAFIVNARTDTSTTNTILRTLDTQRDFTFLSYDLTLIAADGTVLPYPKPLTIDRHSLVAVKTPLLSGRERVRLVVQSRAYSTSGRLIGRVLTKTRRPAATTNAVGQRLVPQHHYVVTRLVPHARIAPRARLAGMVVFERGEVDAVCLKLTEALETLVANGEDFAGFPPYAEIDEVPDQTGGRDLRLVERQIVEAAMMNRPSVLMRSETSEWYRMLAAFVDGALQALLFEQGQSASPAPELLDGTALT